MVSEDNKIKFDDINYAIYKLGKWNNLYQVNILGASNEIPATEVTRNHLEKNMDQIRSSVFNVGGKEVNGMVGLAIQLDANLKEDDVDDIVVIEETEYGLIKEELANLELEDVEDSVELDNDKFLIYKLEYDGHMLVSKPVNDFTKKHHIEEIRRLKELSGNE